MKRVCVAAGVAALSFFTAGAEAQVNTEPLRTKIHAQGVSFLLQGTLDGHTGNTNGVTADGLIGGGFVSGRSLAFAFASIDYSKLNGSLGVDKSFAHLRYNYEFRPWLAWELFAQAQSDHFQRIAIRDLLGTGPRFAIYRDPNFKLSVGVAYMFESDVTEDVNGQTSQWQPITHRISTYLTAHALIQDNIDTVGTVYLQPAIDDPSNVRVTTECGFVFKFSKYLSNTLSFTGHYDSRPPSGVLPSDTELKNAIALTL